MELLAAVDFSDSTEKVIENARIISKSLHAKMWLIHVAQPDPDFVGYAAGPQSERHSVASRFQAEHKSLQQYAERLRAEGIDCVALLVQGATVETILHEAEKLSVGMIVVGSHGRGALMRVLVGSTSEGLLRRSSLPVLVVPTHKRTEAPNGSA